MRDTFTSTQLTIKDKRLIETKNKQRYALKQKLACVPCHEKIQLGKDTSSQLTSGLEAQKLVQAWNNLTFALFANKEDEISTIALDKYLQNKKVKRVFPDFKEKELNFHLIPQDILSAEMSKDRYGIPTPNIEWAIFKSHQIDIVIVPGLAFDKEFQRLGRGGGYYDAFIRKARKSAQQKQSKPPLFIGFFLSIQEIPHCPNNSRDEILDGYCTFEHGLVMNNKQSLTWANE